MDPKGPKGEKELEKKTLSRYSKDSKFKGWFLTYPKCGWSKEDVLVALQDRMHQFQLIIEEYIICEEKHKDGSPHLHAFLKLDRKVRLKGDRFDIEILGEKKHGDYEPAKSWNSVKKYIVKGDPKTANYIANFDVEAVFKKQNKKIGIKELESDPLDLLEQGIITGFQLANFVKNQNIYKLLKQKRNGEQFNFDEEVEKKRHFWFYGNSNSGKTYNLRKMMKEDPKNWFQIPTNNDWVGYNNEVNLYIDEYKGQLTIQELNRICDGGSKVNVKGGTTVLNPKCVVYVCSNFNIKECYKKVEEPILETLYNRFNEKMCVNENGNYSIL